MSNSVGMEVSNCLNKNRRKVIITVATILCLVIILLIILGISGKFRNICKYQDIEPTLNSGDLVETLISKDDNALLRLSSFFVLLESSKENPLYMAQRIEEFSLERLGDNQDQLTIHMNCSKVVMYLTRNDYGDLISNKMEYWLPDSDGYELSCETYSVIRWSAIGEHYSCDQMDYFGCQLKDKPDHVIRWIVKSLEFELDGDKEKTKRGKFTTKKKICGRTIG